MKNLFIIALVAVVVYLIFKASNASASTANGAVNNGGGVSGSPAVQTQSPVSGAKAEDDRLRSIYNSIASITPVTQSTLSRMYGEVQVAAANYRNANGVSLPIENDAAAWINTNHIKGGLAGIVQNAGGWTAVGKTFGSFAVAL